MQGMYQAVCTRHRKKMNKTKNKNKNKKTNKKTQKTKKTSNADTIA